MRNIILVTKREFLTQVKKKSFIIITLLAPLMMMAFGAFINYMFQANNTEYVINVADKSGLFTGHLPSDSQLKYVYVNSESDRTIGAHLKEMKDTDGLLIIPSDTGNSFKNLERTTKLLVNKKIGYEAQQRIAQDISKVIRGEKIKALGLDEQKMKDLDETFLLQTENIVDNNKADSDLSFGVKSGLSMLLMYATFMFIIIYGVRVMRSVLEEKNNRVVEIIISSVKPFELMMGKILGVTGVALTQFLVWIGMAVAGAIFLNTGFSSLKNSMPAGQQDMMDKLDLKQMATEISHTLLDMNFPLIITVFIIFFLLGYIFYSSMYAAIGSAVDNETETQQFTIFAIVPLMVAMYGSITIIKNPDGPMAYWLSMIPFTSPVAMVARIPFGVPLWQIALSVLLLVLTTLAMVYIAAKIYRVGILMYGNKATAKELWKWIRS